MKIIKSIKGELISHDYQSIKGFSLIVLLIATIVGMTFAMAKVSFGEFTPVIATLLSALVAIVVKTIQKYFGETDYAGKTSKSPRQK